MLQGHVLKVAMAEAFGRGAALTGEGARAVVNHFHLLFLDLPLADVAEDGLAFGLDKLRPADLMDEHLWFPLNLAWRETSGRL